MFITDYHNNEHRYMYLSQGLVGCHLTEVYICIVSYR